MIISLYKTSNNLNYVCALTYSYLPTSIAVFLFSARFSLTHKKDQRHECAGDCTAEMSLPTDTEGECIDHITCYRKDRIEQVDQFLRVQAINQVGSHQAPDRATGPDMDPGTAKEVDHQRRTKHRNNIDQQVLPSSDPVFKDKTINNERIHITGEMQPPAMQEPAENKPQVFTVLERACLHSIVIYDVKLTASKLIQSRQSVQDDQHKGNPWDPCFPWLLLCHFLWCTPMMPRFLLAIRADFRTFFERHTAFFTVDNRRVGRSNHLP